MNVNKVQLRTQIQMKEQSALKCMEFATEFMLKKAEYRLLNPLCFGHMNKKDIDDQAQLMAQLNTYSYVLIEKPINKSIVKSKLISGNTTKKESSSLIQLPAAQLTSKIASEPNKSLLPNIKPTQSHMTGETPLVKQQINPKKIILIPKPTQLDFSSDEEVKSNASSKKSKSKFQKVNPPSKKSNFKPQEEFPSQMANFKKKSFPTPTIDKQRPLNQSPIIKQVNSDPDSDDSFDNFPLARSQGDKKNALSPGNQRSILKTQDFHSYRSSTLSDANKMEIDVVSEHASENDVSYASNVRRKGSAKQHQKKIALKQSSSSAIVLKKSIFSSQVHQNLTKPSIVNDERSIQKESINSNNDEFAPLQQQPANKTPQQQQVPPHQQISNYLMKLESFEVQQTILLKKLAKVWSQQSPCVKQIKNIKWDDLKLPKPSFHIKTYQYANVIE